MTKPKRAQLTQLAALRPMMPVQALIDIMGDEWVAPDDHSYSWQQNGVHIFGAQFDDAGRLAVVSFYKAFPAQYEIDGLHTGMTVAAARSLYPALALDADEEPPAGFEFFKCVSSTGNRLSLRFNNNRLIGFDIADPNAQSAGAAPRKTYPVPANIKAYDLALLPHAVDRAARNNHGWCFGLPPGITSAQWPLDPITGYPLMHGFTLKLPPDYRVHGEQFVALSFFATAADQNDGGADTDQALYDAVTGASSAPPAKADLLPFWQHAQTKHPQLHRMQDILNYEYAVILLTEAEFNGPLCQPPQLPRSKRLARIAPPQWLAEGAGYAYATEHYRPDLDTSDIAARYRIDWLPTAPESALDWNRAIHWTPRAEDPNAGVAPEESFGDGPSPSGYVSPTYFKDGVIEAETWREHAWAQTHLQNHIGGTMRPIQSMPSFSPFYIGFEEYFGGYNFGTGNAQLDFLEMKIDWACG